jgi:hypothetical protein
MIIWRSTKKRGKERLQDDRGNRAIVKTRDFICDAEVHELVDAFESGTIAPSQFNHAAHMAAALSYLARFPFTEASARMRMALLKFTARHGIEVYHETITIFWMRLLDHLANGRYRDVPLWSRINLIVKRWEHAGVVEAHYSHELISSKAARQSWMLPDRLSLNF